MAKPTNRLTTPFVAQLAKDTSQRPSAVDRGVDLLARIAAGDDKAMHALYERHRGSVLRFVMRFVRGRSAAEDVVNEVFFDVWRAPSAFQGRSRVSTWLMAIARNKAIAAVHRRSAEPLSDTIAELVEDPDDDPETIMEKHQRDSIIRKCLAKLSPMHREIIDLIYYRERKIDDVAKAIGVPRNTVKTRMFYARKELGRLLGAQGVTTASSQ